MSTAVRFREHADFHRATAAMLVAAVGSALLYWGCQAAGLSTWLAALPIAAAIGFAVSRTGGPVTDVRHHRVQWAFRSALVFIGIAALLLTDGYMALFAFGAAIGGAFAIGRTTGLSAALSGVVGALGGVLALEVAVRVTSSSELSSVPPVGLAAIAGAGFALTLAVPLAWTHLYLVSDLIARRYPEVRNATSGEIQELVIRAHGVWNQVRDLPEDDPNRKLLNEAVLKLFDTAERWGAADAETRRDSEASLRERMESLSARIEATSDDQVRSEYKQAHAALNEQLKYLSGIRSNRERVIARLHNYLAAMERLRLAAVNVRSTNATRQDAEVAPMIESLAELGEIIERDTPLDGDA